MSMETNPGQSYPRRPEGWPPLSPPPAQSPTTLGLDDDEERGKKEKRKKKRSKGKLGSDRGIETMFRTSYRTHIDMSGLADSKANIMISINGLIMSIMIASISPKIDTNAWLLLPTSILLVSCLASMLFAILAARPRVTTRALTLDDVRGERANILFFGNFVNLREQDFVTGMAELLQNPDALYLTMLKDIYSLGNVLQRKFRYLRWAYTIFMAGLAAGVIAFIIVLISVALAAGTPAA